MEELNIESIVEEKVTEEMQRDFLCFAVNTLWKQYKENIMNIETIIKNKIDSINISFPNGTVGKEYRNEISISDIDITEFSVKGLEKIGLIEKINENGIHEISGIPNKQGEFDIRLSCKYKGWVEGKNLVEKIFHISINPDPKTLWQNIPTPKDIEYYKDDFASNYVCVGTETDVQKDIVAASQRGRSHANKGISRDDDFAIDFCKETGWYIIAVADGAGSAPYSREGSKLACATAINHCKEKLKNSSDFEEFIKMYKSEGETDNNRKYVGDNIYDIVGNAAFKAHRAISEEATKKGRNIKEYATTLMLAICKKFDFGWFVGSFWVGDGAMAIYNKEKQKVKLLGTPDGGEFAGQTRFLTMREIFSDSVSLYKRLTFSIEEDFTALMLMTDGVSDPKFGAEANLYKIEKWNELWDDINKEVELTDNNASSSQQLLKWLDFWAEGEHDDRTIAILY